MLATYQIVAKIAATLLHTMDNVRSFTVLQYVFSNSDPSPRYVSLFSVPPGGSISINNSLFYHVDIQAKSLIQGAGGWVIPPTYSLYVSAESDDEIVCTVSGELNGNPPNQFGPG